MGVDDDVNFFRFDSGGGEGERQFLLSAINRPQFVTEFVTNSRLDDDSMLSCLHDSGIEAQQNAVLLVGRSALLPQRLGHDPEHRATVEEIKAVAQNGDLEIPHRRAPANQIIRISPL